MAMIEQAIETWTQLLQQHKERLAHALAGLTMSRQNLDDLWDRLWEYRRIRHTSQEILEATTSASKDEVLKIVSDNLRELIEKTPDPEAPWVRLALKSFNQTVRTYENLAWDREQRVRECEEILEFLRAARDL